MIQDIRTAGSSISRLIKRASKVNVLPELKQFKSYFYVAINQRVPLLLTGPGQVVIHFYFCACVTAFSQGWFSCEPERLRSRS